MSRKKKRRKEEFRIQNSEDRRQKTEDRREEIEQKITKEAKKKRQKKCRRIEIRFVGKHPIPTCRETFNIE